METQINTLQELGILEEYIFEDEKTGSFVSRPAWNDLMSVVRPSDISVSWTDVAFVRREEAIPDNSSIIGFAKNWKREKCYPQRPILGRQLSTNSGRPSCIIAVSDGPLTRLVLVRGSPGSLV